MKDLLVIGVCTNPSDQMKNWEHSLTINGYDYEIIGLGEKWGGWPWRTEQYIRKLKTLDPDIIVILSDVTDVLFIQRKDVFLSKFLSHDRNKVVIGAEPACCTGEFSKNREYANTEAKRKTSHRYRFPNGGVLFGRSSVLLNFLESNKSEEDDQAGYLKKWINGDNSFLLDTNQKFIANIPLMNKWVRVSDDSDMDEMNYWEIKDNTLMNNHSKETPVIVHFPGKNWKDYNIVGKKYLSEFRNIISDNSTPQKDGNDGKNRILMWALIVLLILLVLFICYKIYVNLTGSWRTDN